jgi:hypothetical protein
MRQDKGKTILWVLVLGLGGIGIYMTYQAWKKKQSATPQTTPQAKPIVPGMTLAQAQAIILQNSGGDPFGYVKPRLDKLSIEETVTWANAIKNGQKTYIYNGTSYNVNSRF